MDLDFLLDDDRLDHRLALDLDFLLDDDRLDHGFAASPSSENGHDDRTGEQVLFDISHLLYMTSMYVFLLHAMQHRETATYEAVGLANQHI